MPGANQLQPIVLPPGLSKNGTSYATNRWYDSSLIRFRDAFVEKIGGWIKATTETFDGVCRCLTTFSIKSGTIYTAIGTSTHVYVSTGGLLTDITPLRDTNTLANNKITTSISSAIITIEDIGHGASIGDFVVVSGATATGGIAAADLNIEMQILSIPTNDTFTCTAGGTASSSTSGGGAGVTVKYLINPGSGATTFGTGWGTSTYGRSTWGSDASSTAIAGGGLITQWSIENYGEDLIINPRNGALYYWYGSTPTTRAVEISTVSGADSAPVIAIRTVVSIKDRHVIACGCDPDDGTFLQDRMVVRWSDNENPVDWETATTTKTAGEKRLTQGSTIITAHPTRGGLLIWTDKSLYLMDFIGGEFVFSFDVVANAIDIAGFNAAVDLGETIFWMGRSGFWTYSGNVNILPCDVQDFILTDIDWDLADKITAGTNLTFHEVNWFYPSKDSPDGENDKYVTYNAALNVWYVGELARSCWQEASFSTYPLAASTDGYLYSHDYGGNDGSGTTDTAMDAYIESGPLELGNGDSFSFISRIIHDVTFRGIPDDPGAPQQMNIVLKTGDYPGDAITDSSDSTTERTSTSPVERFTTQSFVRLRGRQFRIRAESDTLGSMWRLGKPRVTIRTDGQR